jgi:hypothetical protein
MALIRAERPPEERAAVDRARERLRRVLSQTPSDPPELDQVGIYRKQLDEETPARCADYAEKHKLQLCYRGSASTEATNDVCPYACVCVRSVVPGGELGRKARSPGLRLDGSVAQKATGDCGDSRR